MTNKEPSFSHLDGAGNARMVDVGEKSDTSRIAIAQGELHFSSAAAELFGSGQSKKGDIFTVAKLAGIMAAKRTSELIPLCHPLPLSFVDVSFELPEGASHVVATAEARTTGKTGVEMEALTALNVALLTLYDMCKSADRSMIIQNVRLLHKSGGKSGEYGEADP